MARGQEGHTQPLATPQQPHGPESHLVTSTNVLLAAVQVHTLGNVWGLLLQGHQHIARLVVKT